MGPNGLSYINKLTISLLLQDQKEQTHDGRVEGYNQTNTNYRITRLPEAVRSLKTLSEI